MEAVIVLTKTVYDKFIAPLNSLGVSSFTEGCYLGLLTDHEYRFLANQLGDLVPSEVRFSEYQQAQFGKIRF